MTDNPTRDEALEAVQIIRNFVNSGKATEYKDTVEITGLIPKCLPDTLENYINSQACDDTIILKRSELEAMRLDDTQEPSYFTASAVGNNRLIDKLLLKTHEWDTSKYIELDRDGK